MPEVTPELEQEIRELCGMCPECSNCVWSGEAGALERCATLQRALPYMQAFSKMKIFHPGAGKV